MHGTLTWFWLIILITIIEYSLYSCMIYCFLGISLSWSSLVGRYIPGCFTATFFSRNSQGQSLSTRSLETRIRWDEHLFLCQKLGVTFSQHRNIKPKTWTHKASHHDHRFHCCPPSQGWRWGDGIWTLRTQLWIFMPNTDHEGSVRVNLIASCRLTLPHNHCRSHVQWISLNWECGSHLDNWQTNLISPQVMNRSCKHSTSWIQTSKSCKTVYTDQFNCSEIALHQWINTHINPNPARLSFCMATKFIQRCKQRRILPSDSLRPQWSDWDSDGRCHDVHGNKVPKVLSPMTILWPVSCCDCAKVGKWFCPRASQQDDQGVELMWICWRCNRKTPGMFASETTQKEGWWVVD